MTLDKYIDDAFLASLHRSPLSTVKVQALCVKLLKSTSSQCRNISPVTALASRLEGGTGVTIARLRN